MANLTLQLGLLTVAAKSTVAVEKKISADMVNLCVGQPQKDAHPTTPSPLKQTKSCATCGPIEDYTVLKKGVKQGNVYAVVEQTDVAEAKEYAKQYLGVIDLVAHPAEKYLNETAPGDTLHYLVPADAIGANHYQLMVKLIRSHPELAFVSLHTPKSVTAQYMVRVREGVLIMEKRVDSAAVKPAPSVGGVVEDVWYAAVEGMLPTLITEYDADAYEDKYEAALATMLETAETISVAGDAPAKTTPRVMVTNDDLLAKMQALNASANVAA